MMHKNPKNTDDYQQVINAEKERLELGDKTSGFAISGGGIRSASFGLGVMQALVGDNKLSKMDYLSTVSGGGYIGAALTWALKQGRENAGTTPGNFPLGTKGASARPDKKEEQHTHKPNGLLDFIRQHSSYLLPVNKLGAVSFVAVALRSILLSLFFYMLFLTSLMFIVNASGLFDKICFDHGGKNWFSPLTFSEKFIPASIFLIAVLLLLNLLYSLRTFFKRNSMKNYRAFIAGQKFHGFVWKAIFLFLLFGSLPYVHNLLDNYMNDLAAGGTSTLFGTIVGAWQYVKAQKKESSNGAMSGIMIYLGAFALVYGLLLIAFAFATGFAAKEESGWTIFIGLAALTLIFGIFVNLNQVGPHRLWRDRLMEAFMPNKDAVKKNVWQPATEADNAMMEDMCDVHNRRPYHIINTNIILVDSPTVKFRGRGGDNFIISPLYCGSDSTGWRTTTTFQKKDGRGITLATAMATSAAALNPNAGCSGEGVTRNSVVSILLSILNLRLGYWTTNPKNDPLPFPPNFFVPGLSSEVTRRGLKESSRNIQLSDGGHFENLAVYELIRRKVKLIILSDGGADPEFNFDDLANAVEKVRVDFGVKICFEDKDLNSILGGTAGESLFDKKYNIAKQGYAIAKIYYNDGSEGMLAYIKLSMIPNLPTDIYSYKGLNPTFPHQSTADQFFNEKQFEAYRELGYNVTKAMLKDEGEKLFGGE
ncbi:MAG: hypothetical protein M3R17_19515 [Bacteroidota bacterium]|nr:hypothetical protein [Bacteroidota bacterium]